MKKILIIAVVLLMASCNNEQKKQTVNKVDKKVNTTVKKSDKKEINKAIEVFNIEKNCTVCHKLPEFSKKDASYLEKKLYEHRKFKRINLEDAEFNKLRKRILKRAKKADSEGNK